MKINIAPGFRKNMTDDELKAWVRPQGNGAYTTQICRYCGSYYFDYDGDIDTAEIVDICKKCFDQRRNSITLNDKE